MSENPKPTYILINISSLEDIVFISLTRLEDVLKTTMQLSTLDNHKPLDALVAIFDNYGQCLSYKKHIITPGIPTNTIVKRVYYSILLLLKDLNIIQ